jgi:hypothetical protein
MDEKKTKGFLGLLTDGIIDCNPNVVITIARVKILEQRCKGNAKFFFLFNKRCIKNLLSKIMNLSPPNAIYTFSVSRDNMDRLHMAPGKHAQNLITHHQWLCWRSRGIEIKLLKFTHNKNK